MYERSNHLSLNAHTRPDTIKIVIRNILPEKMLNFTDNYLDKQRYRSAKANNTEEIKSVEVNKKSNSDIYRMFANLDVSCKENFQSSFENALVEFRNYFISDPIENYNGTSGEQRQLDELLKRFNNFI